MRDTSTRTPDEATTSLDQLTAALADYRAAQRCIVRAPAGAVISMADYRQRRMEDRRIMAAIWSGEI
jgi:hypothetical protein